MAEFIQPLDMRTWLIQVFSGNPDIFLAVALFTIASMSAYFRMNIAGLFFMISIFILMFSGYIQSPLIVLIAIIGGLVIGFLISQFVRR